MSKLFLLAIFTFFFATLITPSLQLPAPASKAQVCFACPDFDTANRHFVAMFHSNDQVFCRYQFVPENLFCRYSPDNGNLTEDSDDKACPPQAVPSKSCPKKDHR